MLRVILLLTIAIHGVSSTSCQLGWREFKGYCYSFSDESVSWLDAAGSCHYYNARLAQVDSQPKQDYIAGQLAVNNIDRAWIGGSSRYHQSIWEWVPSLKPIIYYSNWDNGEPNYQETERCMEMKRDKEFRWNNVPCSTTNIRFVCEKKLQEELPTQVVPYK